MGQFTNTNHDKILDNINTIKENTDRLRNSPATRFMDKTPVKGTFYNINFDHSTVKQGSEEINSSIGVNSPLMFDKISDCVMYGLQEWDKQKEDDEYEGFAINRDNVSIIPVDTFEPIEGSFFKLELDDYTVLYRVSHVERTMIKNLSCFKVEYESEFANTHEKFDLIEEQIVRNFTMIYENVGTENKVLIQDDQIQDLEELEQFTRKLNKLYNTQYYDEKSDTVIYKDNMGRVYYSSYVVEFLKSSETLFDLKYDSKLMFSHELNTEDNFDYKFHNSLYLKILNGEPLIEEDFWFTVRFLADDSFEFNFTKLNIYNNLQIINLERDEEILLYADQDGTGGSNSDGDTIDTFTENYHHIQSEPLSDWVVTHSLGMKFPDVNVVVDDTVVETDVTFNSENQLTVHLGTPLTGEVYIYG